MVLLSAIVLIRCSLLSELDGRVGAIEEGFIRIVLTSSKT